MYVHRNGIRYKVKEKKLAWYNPKRWLHWLKKALKKKKKRK